MSASDKAPSDPGAADRAGAAPAPENPFVGPRALGPTDPLFGRETEIATITTRLVAEGSLLFYAPSGAGKTSLIQAGLAPALRERDFDVRPVIRVGLAKRQEGTNRFATSVIACLTSDAPNEGGVTADEPVTAADLPGRIEALLGDAATRRDVVLIFDQFEEVLTLDAHDRAAKEAFFDALGAALSPDRRVWALFALREDHLAAIEPYLRRLPGRGKARLRMDLLGVDQAREAIVETAKTSAAGVVFEPEAALALADSLARVRVEGTDDTEPGQYVEPVQLQVVCRRLWEKRRPGATTITVDDVRAAGDVDAALRSYYEEKIEAIAADKAPLEKALRTWIDTALIARGKARKPVLESDVPAEPRGLEAAVSALVDAHLVRRDKRGVASWLELSHDRLVEPVAASNAEWLRTKLSATQRAAALWHEHGRAESWLLKANALDEALKWMESVGPESLSSVEKDFHAACLKAKEREEKDQFLRWVLFGVLVAFAAAAVVAVIFWRRARDERAGSERARNVAMIRFLVSRGTDARDETSALFVREAYLRSLESGGAAGEEIDDALRAVLTQETFEHAMFVSDLVYSTALSPDGTRIAAGDSEGRIHLWDIGDPAAPFLPVNPPPETELGAALVRMANPPPEAVRAHSGSVLALAFTRDGKTLASGGIDGSVRVWDLAGSGKLRRDMHEHFSAVRAVAWHPKKELLTSGGDGESVRLWRPSEDAQSVLLPPADDGEHPGVAVNADNRMISIAGLAFSGDGDVVVSASWDGDVAVWSLHDLDATPRVLLTDDRRMQAVSIAERTGTIAAGGESGVVHVWPPRLDAEPRQFRVDSEVTSVALDPDADFLLIGTRDGAVTTWDLSGAPAASKPGFLRRRGSMISGISFASRANRVAWGEEAGVVRVVDHHRPPLTTTTVLQGWPKPKALAVGAGGRRMAACGEGTSVLLLEPGRRRRLLDARAGHTTTVMEFDPAGDTLAIGDTGGEVKLVRSWAKVAPGNDWPDPDSEQNGGEPAQGDAVSSRIIEAIAFSPKGRWIAVGDESGRVLLSDRAKWPSTITLPDAGPDADMQLAFSSEDRVVALANVPLSRRAEVRVWSLGGAAPALERKGTLSLGDGSIVALSPDGRFAAATAAYGATTLYRLDGGDPTAVVLPRHISYEDGVYARDSKFSPDGKWLALAMGASVWLWSTDEPGSAPMVMSQYRSEVRKIAFSPDGRVLGAAGDDGYLVLQAPTYVLADEICRLVWRNLTGKEWDQYLDVDDPYRRTCENLPEGFGVQHEAE